MLNLSADLDSAFAQAEVQAQGEFTPLPQGKYIGRFELILFDESKLCLERKFKVTEGDHAGKTQKDWLYLTKADGSVNDVAMSILKTEMACYEPAMANCKMSEVLYPFITACESSPVEVYASCKQRKDDPTKYNTNLKIQRFLKEEETQQPTRPF